jgi:hypothetical protein
MKIIPSDARGTPNLNDPRLRERARQAGVPDDDKARTVSSVRVTALQKRGTNRFDHVLVVRPDSGDIALLAEMQAPKSGHTGLRSVMVLKVQASKTILAAAGLNMSWAVDCVVSLTADGNALLLPTAVTKGWPTYFKFDASSPMWKMWGVDEILPKVTSAAPPLTAPIVPADVTVPTLTAAQTGAPLGTPSLDAKPAEKTPADEAASKPPTDETDKDKDKERTEKP